MDRNCPAVVTLFKRFYREDMQGDVFTHLLSLPEEQLANILKDLQFVTEQVEDMVNYHRDMKEYNDVPK